MADTRALSVATPTSREIVLTRAFDAPRERVFDALTRPELLMRWLGANGWTLVVCEVDLRVGGRWRFESMGPGGETLAHGGVYREIVAPHRLVCTEVFDEQSYPGESLITHVLVDEQGTTTLSSTVRYPTPEARDIVLRYPMARGVADGYQRLDHLLARPVRQPARKHEQPARPARQQETQR